VLLAQAGSQTVDTLTLAFKEILGKPAVRQKGSVNLSGSNGVQSESRQVLQTKIQIGIDEGAC